MKYKLGEKVCYIDKHDNLVVGTIERTVSTNKNVFYGIKSNNNIFYANEDKVSKYYEVKPIRSNNVLETFVNDIKEVRMNICDDICKFHSKPINKMTDEEIEELQEKHCDGCPVERLMY